jgi:hypothetical protein
VATSHVLLFVGVVGQDIVKFSCSVLLCLFNNFI